MVRKRADSIKEITSEHIENNRSRLESEKTDSEILEMVTIYLTESSKTSLSGFPIGPNEYDVCISDDVCGNYQSERPLFPQSLADMLPIGTTIELGGVVKLYQKDILTSEGRRIAFRGKINSTVVWLGYTSARLFAEDNADVLRHLGMMDRTGRILSSPNQWSCYNLPL